MHGRTSPSTGKWAAAGSKADVAAWQKLHCTFRVVVAVYAFGLTLGVCRGGGLAG